MAVDAHGDANYSYQFSRWVSGAIFSSTPSFSGGDVSTLPKGKRQTMRDDSPRSLMLKTPLTVLLDRRCLGLISLGDAGASSMAESTLVNGSWTSADMMVGVMGNCWMSESVWWRRLMDCCSSQERS